MIQIHPDSELVEVLDNEFAFAALEIVSPEEPCLHFEIKVPYTKALHKWAKGAFEELLVILGVQGYENIFSVLPSEDEKAIKFNKMMGMKFLRHFGEHNQYTAMFKEIQ